jgi:hypothetical protein
MTKFDWLPASALLRVGGVALRWSVFCAVGVQFANFPANRKQAQKRARLLLRPRTIHTFQQKPNPSGDPDPKC